MSSSLYLRVFFLADHTPNEPFSWEVDEQQIRNAAQKACDAGLIKNPDEQAEALIRERHKGLGGNDGVLRSEEKDLYWDDKFCAAFKKIFGMTWHEHLMSFYGNGE